MLPFILDTDIGSDVDDALALAFAVRHTGLDLRAVTTVSGDTTRRAKIARKLLHLAGRDDIPVAAGERGEQTQPNRSPEGGHEDEMLGDWPGLDLSPRGGVDVLLDLLGGGDVELATVGMQSNLAHVLGRDPTLPSRLPRLTVMGGVFGEVQSLGHHLPPTIDHNLNVDQAASLRSLNAGFRILYVPCDVTMNTWLLRKHVDRLRAGDDLCREVARQIDIFRREEARVLGDRLPADHMCLLHDPLAVACMIDRSLVETTTAPVTAALHHDHIRTFVDPLEGIDAEIVTSVDAPAFADFWLETVLRP